MAEIHIQFSRAAPNTLFDRYVKDRSKCIARITRSPYSHGDLVVRYQGRVGLLGASDNPGAPIIETTPPGNSCGVALRPVDYQPFAIIRTARLICTHEQKAAFERYCWAQMGKPFDNEALALRTMFSANWYDRDWRADVRWYCMEMLARAGEVAKLLAYKVVYLKNRVTAPDFLIMYSPILANPQDFDI